MSKGQLATVNTQAVVGNFTQQELDTLKATIAKGTTNEQFALFIQTCVNSGLNPFLNHVHCIVYNGKDGPVMSIQIAVEGILYLARQKEGYKGIDVQLVHENDEFKVGRNDAGYIMIKQHDIGFPRGQVIGGYAIAKREGFDDVIVIIESNEVEHMKKGKNAHMWSQWFSDMFKKHIAKRAAKQQYGIEIAEDEAIPGELEQTSSYQPNERRDITPQQQVIQTGEVEIVDEETEKQKLWEGIHSKLNSYSMSKGDLTSIIKEQFNKKPADLSIQQITGLSQLIDLKGREQSISTPFGDIEDKGLDFDFDK